MVEQFAEAGVALLRVARVVVDEVDLAAASVGVVDVARGGVVELVDVVPEGPLGREAARRRVEGAGPGLTAAPGLGPVAVGLAEDGQVAVAARRVGLLRHDQRAVDGGRAGEVHGQVVRLGADDDEAVPVEPAAHHEVALDQERALAGEAGAGADRERALDARDRLRRGAERLRARDRQAARHHLVAVARVDGVAERVVQAVGRGHARAEVGGAAFAVVGGAAHVPGRERRARGDHVGGTGERRPDAVEREAELRDLQVIVLLGVHLRRVAEVAAGQLGVGVDRGDGVGHVQPDRTGEVHRVELVDAREAVRRAAELAAHPHRNALAVGRRRGQRVVIGLEADRPVVVVALTREEAVVREPIVLGHLRQGDGHAAL